MSLERMRGGRCRAVSFETARLVFDDPHALSIQDRFAARGEAVQSYINAALPDYVEQRQRR